MARRKSKKNTKISKFIYILFLLMSTIFVGIITYLKVIPLKYFASLMIVYLLLNIILGFISIKKSGLLINLICIIFSVLFGVGLYYLNTTMGFMKNIVASNYQIENYYIYVLYDSDYKDIKDLNDKNIGFFNTTSNTYNDAKDKLDKQISYEKTDYKSIINLSRDLLNDKIDAIFVNETALSFIKEEEKNFESKTRLLYTIPIKVEVDDTSKTVDVTKDSFNIYISGIDVYGDISSISRSDVNMIMTINPNTNEILLTSIPRDYYVRLHETKGYKDKLTHSGLYGIDMTVNTIEDLLNIDINYYIRVNFTTVIDLVDTIGGIDIYSDTAFTSYTNHSCKFIVGSQHVDGKCALAFSRERYAYTSGDRHRVKNQQDVLTAIINKTTSSATLVTKYNSILNTLKDSFQTNIPSDKIYSLINKQIDEMPNWNIKQISLDGKNSSNYTYSYPSGKLYVMEPDMDTVLNATEKIEELMK